MSILKTLQEMNNNQFMFQKIKYTFTKKYKDFIYKEKYIKSKENLLEYVYLNMFENIYDNKSNYYLHKSNFHENKTDYSDTEEESILYFNYNFTSIIQQIIKNPNITFKLFNRIIEKNLKIHKKLDSNNKLLEDRIFTDLSFNKIDINFILYYKNMGWSSKGISINKYISLEDIFKYPFINWNYKEILKNPNVTMEIFEIIYNLYKNDKNLDLSALSYNCNLTVEIIEKYKDIKWDWGIISSAMKNITLVNYEKYINNWDHHFLSLNIDFNIFDKYNYKNWSYTYLSFNKSLNIEVVIKYLDRDWDWYHISNNKNLYK